MTYVEKAYSLGQKVKAITSQKLFRFFLLFFLSLFMIFGVMNTYAQEDIPKISPDWVGTKEFYNTASGIDSEVAREEDNMTSHSGQLGLNTAWVILSTLAPGVTEGADAIQTSSTIPGDMKLGLLGNIDKGWETIYRNPPSVNLVAHLQEEWVPGYDQSQSGLYAANGENVSGYQSLLDSGIAPLWGQFRNMAYIFLVVVMIAVGFMIMFRSKIGGQLMVSIGNTIPNVVISLIMITFSFAIAGLIIDIGGILISLLYSIFEGKSISTQDFGSLFAVLFRGVSISDISDAVGDHFSTAAEGFTTSIFTGIWNIFAATWETLLIGVWGLLFFIIGLGVVAVGAIKLLITLYKTYFELILNVVLGPIKILMGTLPGNEAMRTNWLSSLMRNVLVFPIVYFIVNIPVYLSSILGENNVVLSFPSKLTGAQLGDTGANLSTGEGYIGLIINFVLRVFVIYYAAQAPKFAEAIIPVKETNKAVADAMAGAKMSMSKAPLIGGLFK